MNTDTVTFRQVALDYFKCWNNKDLAGLKRIISEDARLIDWEIDVTGLVNVLEANQQIFRDLPTIRAEIVSVTVEPKIVIAELNIFISASEVLEVVDILKFTDNYQIKSIKAFKCRELRT